MALEFVLNGQRVGGMLLGRPAARSLDAKRWLELTRMCFEDEAPKNTESRALSRMRKWVRIWMPEIRGLLAYSDPSVGHAGGIYLADGWAPFGMTSANHAQSGWENRLGRCGEQRYSRKHRWVRTP